MPLVHFKTNHPDPQVSYPDQKPCEGASRPSQSAANLVNRAGRALAIAKSNRVYAEAAKLTPDKIATAQASTSSGVPKATFAQELDVNGQTLYTALAGEGKYSEA